jgi:hypothetical protein
VPSSAWNGRSSQVRCGAEASAPEGSSGAERGAVDLGDQLVLRQAGLDQFENPRMHGLDDARGAAHVLELARRLDRPLPVHEAGRVLEGRVGQVALQRGVAGRAEVVVVHLDADPAPLPAAGADHRVGEMVHRMALGRLHVVVGIADDVIMAHEHRASGAIGVLAAAVPDGLPVFG